LTPGYRGEGNKELAETGWAVGDSQKFLARRGGREEAKGTQGKRASIRDYPLRFYMPTEMNNSKRSLTLMPAQNPIGVWQTRVTPLFDKYFLVFCLGLIGIACARVISTYDALSLTVDEPAHLACGLEYLGKHVYRLETQHPPLSRLMVALGPYLAGARPLGLRFGQEGLGVIARYGYIERIIFLMRLGTLPFFALACLVVCAWSCHSFDKSIAVVATALFTLLPTVLADAGMATTDMALGATTGAAFFAAMLWTERPTWLRSVLLGLSVALACLSKFTALGYLPAAVGLALLCYLTVRWPGLRGLRKLTAERSVPFGLAAATAAVVIWAAYWFSFGPFLTNMVPWGHLKLPAPEFFEGVRVALGHNRKGHPAFLLGEYRMTGWWYYFPVALAVKTPVPFLFLLALGVYVCLRERARPAYLFPLAFALGILLPAMRSSIDIGVRHVEPIYIGFAIIAALGVRRLLEGTRARLAGSLAAGGLVSWMLISVAVHHPDYLAYFNGFAGKTPEKILVDSNYDWGQDLKLLASRLHQMGVKEFSLAELDGVNRSDYLEAWYGLPTIKELNTCNATPGWNVVGATFEKSVRFVYGYKVPTPWYEQIAPSERVGPFLLYNIPSSTKIPAVNCHFP